MAELKPCKCGSNNLYKAYNTNSDFKFRIFCWDCWEQGPDESTEQQAIDAWNKRS